jgi:RNA polymerase sigma-70 factor (ECF subfamily)
MRETSRIVFMMSRNEELKNREIAERLNISIKAVEKRMSLALKTLREEFSQ